MILKLLQKWLPKSCKLNNFELKLNNNNIRGVYCKKDIKEDDLIIKIHLKYLITVEKCKNNKIINKYFNNLYKNIHNNSLIALFLLLESKNTNSKWKPYLQSLPKKNNHVLTMSQKELNEYKGTTLLNINHPMNYFKYKKKVLNDYNLINNYIKCSLKMFKFYRSLVGSRIFNFSNYNEYNLNGLVPFCDLLNHSEICNTRWNFNHSTKYFELKATQNIPKNTELFDSYGKNKSNTLLLLYYGFTLPNNNNHDIIPMTINKSIIRLSNNKNPQFPNFPNFPNITGKNNLLKKCQLLIKKLKPKHKDYNVNNLRKSNLYILRRIIKMLL